MSEFKRYVELSEFLKYNFSGIELNRITACQIWDIANGRKYFPLRHLGNMFMAYDVKSLHWTKDNGFLSSFMESDRKDHRKLFDSVIDRLSIRPTVNELHSLRKKLVLHPIILFQVASKILAKTKQSGLKFMQRLQWTAEYVLLCNTIRELDAINFSGVKKYLCMCHVLGLENLFTQYFRQKGIITYSLQEGIYFIYHKNIVLGSIAYKLFETDHLLCWGQYTKDEFEKVGIESNRISVAGFPKSAEVLTQKRVNAYKSCLVMLAGPIFGDVNNKLLKMLESLRNDLEVTLKPHPSNYDEMKSYAIRNKFNIASKSLTVGDCFASGEYDFCVAVNTTAYYESWMAGIPCIRYYDDRFDDFYGFDDLFTEKEELLSLIEKYRITPRSDEAVKDMLKYSIGVGIDNYDVLING